MSPLPDLAPLVEAAPTADPAARAELGRAFAAALGTLTRITEGGNRAHALRAAEMICRVWMARRRHRAAKQ